MINKYYTGTRIYHTIFGSGTVERVEDGWLYVKFEKRQLDGKVKITYPGLYLEEEREHIEKRKRIKRKINRLE